MVSLIQKSDKCPEAYFAKTECNTNHCFCSLRMGQAQNALQSFYFNRWMQPKHGKLCTTFTPSTLQRQSNQQHHHHNCQRNRQGISRNTRNQEPRTPSPEGGSQRTEATANNGCDLNHPSVVSSLGNMAGKFQLSLNLTLQLPVDDEHKKTKIENNTKKKCTTDPG